MVLLKTELTCTALSILSLKGKKASEASATLSNCLSHAARSASDSGAGAAPSNSDSHCSKGKSEPKEK